MSEQLHAGFAEIDVTPPAGTLMQGSLDPRDRPAQGTHDPLMVHAAVLRSGAERLVVVSFDLATLEHEQMAPFVAQAARETGIPEDHIVWTCTHTHSGPCTGGRCYPESMGEIVDATWLAEMQAKFVECIRAADAASEPVSLSRVRGFCTSIQHNRRVRFKSGRHINTWLLSNVADEGQAIGAAAPVDPEVVMLVFDDSGGNLKGVVYGFSLHVNAHFGREFSADYPGVVGQRLRERFGPQVHAVFLPGGFGDINPIRPFDETGNLLADAMIPELENRCPMDGPHRLGASVEMLTVPLRDLSAANHEERLAASKWAPKEQEFFRSTLREMQEEGRTQIEAPVHVWHIGDTAFAGLPGEPFVEWTMKLKAESPFPWTIPVGLCDDWLGYLVTRDAWEGGGYEGLVAKTAPVSVEGVEQMVASARAQLGRLRKECVLAESFPREVALANGAAMTVRPLGTADGEALAAFYAVIPEEDQRFYYPHALTRENALGWAAEAGSPTFVCLVLETDGGEIVGYAWYRWPAGPERSTFGICLRRDHQGVGGGACLMAALLEIAGIYGPPVMCLTVQKANPRAVKLYTSMGFHPVREQITERTKEPEYYMEMAVR